MVIVNAICGILGTLAYFYSPHNVEREASSADDLTFFFNVRKGVLLTLIILCFGKDWFWAFLYQKSRYITLSIRKGLN